MSAVLLETEGASLEFPLQAEENDILFHCLWQGITMGLDWIPLGKPKPGFEEEHARIFEALQEANFFDIPAPPLVTRAKQYLEVFLGRRKPSDVGMARSADGPILMKQLDDISIPPHETLKCPRVGFDSGADAWLTETYDRSDEKQEGLPFEEFKRKFHGEFVLALAPPSDGLPRHASGPGGLVEGYCFRAKALTLEGIEDILGPELYNQAWMHFTAEELVDYADRLGLAARRHAETHGIASEVSALERKDDCSLEEEQILILLSAARWCRYWGENGHPVWSDY